ncbi:MAG: hypothetical protein NTV01_12245 [Bacteroidia bacterium]|nr:hypothetical protein [Bacteroidia bacterium]
MGEDRQGEVKIDFNDRGRGDRVQVKEINLFRDQFSPAADSDKLDAILMSGYIYRRGGKWDLSIKYLVKAFEQIRAS